MKTRYILHAIIDYISEKQDPVGISLGWFIRFEGSGESFYISDTEPDLHAGDKVKITLEKVS